MPSSEINFDLIVIGGGASGLFAAGRAAEMGNRVLLLEKNRRLGEKLRITGGGRCNITNAEPNERVLLRAYGEAEQFLYSSFSQFGVKDTFSFFESKGLPLVVQAKNRVFPKTEKAVDVLKTLEEYVRAGNVVVKTASPVTSVEGMREGITAVVCGKERYTATDYVLATGGVSHPETGSTGDGIKWLEKLGHTVFASTPTIVPLSTKEAWSKKLAGISAPDAKITFFVEGKKAFSETGKILFTHFGLSGPLILNSAQKVDDLLHDGAVTAAIDLFPQLDLGALDKHIIQIFDGNKNKELKNAIKELVPEGMSKGVLELLVEHMDVAKKVHSVSKDERAKMTRTLKALPLTINGLMGFDRAVVADGGVALEEIDTRTMRSKVVSNLYMTGDLLHIKRPSGGYSLQLCWTTGYVAGTHAGARKS